MRIGILTYHSGFNYGACLQAYALQTILKKFGFKSEIINVETDAFVSSREMFSRHPRRMKEIIKNLTRVPYWQSLHERERMFNSYTFDVLKSTSRYKTEQEVIDHAVDYDCIICGSDQIWNLTHVKDDPAITPLFFLNFPKKQRRIAYAASFASFTKIAHLHEDEFLPWLKEFDAISIREQDGYDYVKSKGIDCTLTLDPTILLDKEDYEPICKARLIKEKYVLMFGWNTNNDLVEVAKKVSNKMGLPVYNIVPPPRAMFCGIPRKLDVGPCEFLSMIKNAEFVVTNSFHGTAFATTLERPYVSVVTGKADTRMHSLLEQLGLADHLATKENVNVDKMLATDFIPVQEKKVALRQTSFNFLKSALNGL